MKKLIIILLTYSFGTEARAQTQEAKQLLLNVEKLAQFRKMLNNMYQGYKIIYKGYSTIKDISEGNFSLHKSFLDGLLQVSPGVRKYKRIADIMNYQFRIVKESKNALSRFKQNKHFSKDEIKYLNDVYTNLLHQSIKCLDELAIVITSGRLRMSDDERLQTIDRIYNEVIVQFSFLKNINNSTEVLAVQREKEMQDIEFSRKIYAMKK